LGNLFKSSRKQLKKTELVVFINSKTIRKSNDMKAIVDGVKQMFSDTINMYTNDDEENESQEENEE
jgi:type II secretory pathway component GspD/PulD (secretin)